MAEVYTDSIRARVNDEVQDVPIRDTTKSPAIIPTVTGTGEVTITDASDESKLQNLTMRGTTEQVQTTGAQLLQPKAETDGKTTVVYGLSVMQENMKIKVNGTATISGGRSSYFATATLSPGNYYFSSKKTGSSNLQMCLSNISDNSFIVNDSIKTFEISEETEVGFGINFSSGVSYNEEVSIMLNIGSEPLPYEPYTERYPSPRPEMPSKNLLDYSLIQNKEMNGITFTNNNDGTFTVNGTATAQATTDPVTITLPAGTYYVSDNNDSEQCALFVQRTPAEGDAQTVRNGTITIAEGDTVTAYLSVSAEAVLDNFVLYPMIEKGTSKSFWEAYGTVPAHPQEIVSAGKHITGAQLFDKETAIPDKFVSDTGGHEGTEVGTYASDYINVEGLSNIICTDTINKRWMAFYDAEKVYISGYNGYGVAIAVPENAVYARFTIANDYIDKFMLNAGETLLPYEPYTAGEEQWQYEIGVGGAQLFDASKIATKTQGGATLTNNDDGSFTISGNGNLESQYSNRYDMTHEETLKLIKKDGRLFLKNPETVPNFIVYVIKKDGGVLYNLPSAEQSQIDVNVNDIVLNEAHLRFIFYSNTGETITPITIKPMLYQDGDGTWESYRTRQSALLTTTRPLTKWDKLEKRNGQWGWVYKSNIVEFDGSEDENWNILGENNNRASIALNDMKYNADSSNDIAKSNYFKHESSVFYDSMDIVGMCEFANMIFFRFGSGSEINSVETLRAWLSENPLTVLYETSTETFTPLPEEEQSAMNALVMYAPTTVLTADTGDLSVELEVFYIADTTTYLTANFVPKSDYNALEARVSALESAAVNNVTEQ